MFLNPSDTFLSFISVIPGHPSQCVWLIFLVFLRPKWTQNTRLRKKNQIGMSFWTFFLHKRFPCIDMVMHRCLIPFSQPGAFPLTPGNSLGLMFLRVSTANSKVLSQLSEGSRMAPKWEIHSLAPISAWCLDCV